MKESIQYKKLNYKDIKDTTSKNIWKLYTIITSVEILAISSILLVCFSSVESLTIKNAAEAVIHCLSSFWIGEILRVMCNRTILKKDLYDKYYSEHMLNTLNTIK